MLKLRLQRVGRVHEPSFRLVLTDSKNSTKSGRFKEILGSYDPRKSADSFDSERIKYWLSQGVGITDTVNNLLIKHRIINGKKIDVSAKSKKAPSSAEATAGKPEVVKEEKKEEVVAEGSKEEAVEVIPEAKEVETPENVIVEETPVPASAQGSGEAMEKTA